MQYKKKMNIGFTLLFLAGVYLHYFSPSPVYYRKGWSYSLCLQNLLLSVEVKTFNLL